MDSVLKLYLSIIRSIHSQESYIYFTKELKHFVLILKPFGLIKLCCISATSLISSLDVPHHTYLGALNDF